jgi:hypothetical protein
VTCIMACVCALSPSFWLWSGLIWCWVCIHALFFVRFCVLGVRFACAMLMCVVGDTIGLPSTPTADRIDILLHVQYTVKEFDCDLTRDISALINREQDLLRRGRSAQSLSALRQRLSNLFLQFVKTPQFNPEAAAFVKVLLCVCAARLL